MEIDTGSCTTIITQSTWKRLGKPPLQPSSKTLQSYTGHCLSVSGVISVEVAVKDQVKKLSAIVVNGCGGNLLGRDWMNQLKLNWNDIFTINAISRSGNIKRKLHLLQEEFGEIFKDELGTCKGYEAQIHLKPDATPKFWKPRPLPYSMREAVGQELDRLESRDVLEKISFSEWAAPIVARGQGDKSSPNLW